MVHTMPKMMDREKTTERVWNEGGGGGRINPNNLLLNIISGRKSW